MQILVEMAKTLAVFCLMEQLILNLLPASSYERYVKFYLGLLLLILLLHPVLQLFRMTGQLDSRVFTHVTEWEERSDTWKTGWEEQTATWEKEWNESDSWQEK